jgi:hypothetical protein
MIKVKNKHQQDRCNCNWGKTNEPLGEKFYELVSGLGALSNSISQNETTKAEEKINKYPKIIYVLIIEII